MRVKIKQTFAEKPCKQDYFLPNKEVTSPSSNERIDLTEKGPVNFLSLSFWGKSQEYALSHA